MSSAVTRACTVANRVEHSPHVARVEGASHECAPRCLIVAWLVFVAVFFFRSYLLRCVRHGVLRCDVADGRCRCRPSYRPQKPGYRPWLVSCRSGAESPAVVSQHRGFLIVARAVILHVTLVPGRTRIAIGPPAIPHRMARTSPAAGARRRATCSPARDPRCTAPGWPRARRTASKACCL